LDPPQLQPPGWFGGAEIQVVKPRLISGLRNTVKQADGSQATVSVPSAHLQWTVAPRVFGGYRLPSGFGEFMIDYRHLATHGTGADGSMALGSRFAFDMIDVDYNSRELSLGPKCGMKWTLGLRTLLLFFDSQANQSAAQAAAGNGLVQQRNSNNLYGVGPHMALELTRRLGDSGFSFLTWVDVAGTFANVFEDYTTRSAPSGPTAKPFFGRTQAFGHQASPMINARAGLSWQPTPTSATRIFAGYQYEVIWDLDRVPNNSPFPFNYPSLGQFFDQGLVLQATIRW
jgi:hypothetical protein